MNTPRGLTGTIYDFELLPDSCFFELGHHTGELGSLVSTEPNKCPWPAIEGEICNTL